MEACELRQALRVEPARGALSLLRKGHDSGAAVDGLDGGAGLPVSDGVAVFAAARRSVVHIRVRTFSPGALANARLDNDNEWEVLGPGEVYGSGTGFVWDGEGHVVTNYHVVSAPDTPARKRVIRATVTSQDTIQDHSVSAALVGADPDRDIALLRLSLEQLASSFPDLRPVQRGSSESLQVGQRVFAIGSPFGLPLTLTTGIISGLGREILPSSSPAEAQEQPLPSPNLGLVARRQRPIFNVIQTDAAINPGSSGGPLLDASGNVVGVTAAIASTAGGAFAGVGFALPIDTVARVVDKYLIPPPHEVPRAVLGVILASAALLGRLGAQRAGLRGGVVVLAVRPGGAAEKSGVKGFVKEGRQRPSGDVILSVDGKGVKSEVDVLRILDDKEVGMTVRLGLLRDGSEVFVDIELEAAQDVGSPDKVLFRRSKL